MENKSIPSSFHTKFLIVTIDCKVRWKQEIDNLNSTILYTNYEIALTWLHLRTTTLLAYNVD